MTTRKSGNGESAASQLRRLQSEIQQLRRLADDQAATNQQNRRDHELTFQRMAQLQAELDEIKRAFSKLMDQKSEIRGQRSGG